MIGKDRNQRKNWFDIPMRAWEDRSRVVLLLLGVQIAALVVAYLIVFFSDILADANGSRRFFEAGVIVVAFMAGGTVTAGFLLADRMSDRLKAMVDLVDHQIKTSELQISETPRNIPEVEYLAITLEKLSQAYRASIDAITQRVEELMAVKVIAETVNQTLNLQEVIDLSLSEILRIIGWRAGGIYIFEDDPMVFTMVSFEGYSDETVREIIILDEDHPIFIESLKEGNNFFEAPLPGVPDSEEVTICVPLRALSENMLGLLIFTDKKHPGLNPSQRRVIATISHQVSLAMDKAQLHSELNVYARKLESLVAERTKQLNEAISELWDMLRKAQEAERVKTLLLSTVSHELRTPLMTIKGNISLLAMRHKQMTQDQLKATFEDVEDDTDKLTELITNLLDLSRLEGGMLQIVPIETDLGGVIRSAVNSSRVRIQSHPIVFDEVTENFQVKADPRRMEQVLANLIDNAAKYSPPGGEIRVSIARAKNAARVSVSDQGQGIRDEDRERIFERFVQLDPKGDSAHHQGVGLGLAICKGLIEAHDGMIWVESEWGEGATFCFQIPLLPLAEEIKE